MLPHNVFMQLCILQGQYVSGLYDIPGITLDVVSIDLMHTGDLGVLLFLYGNVLWELFVQIGGTAGDPGEALGDLMTMIKSASKAVGQERPPFNKLTLGMLKQPGKSPALKAKAAESRYMLPVILYILETYFKVCTDHEILRHRCVQTISDMYKKMRPAPGEVFDGAAVGKLARQHLILYTELARESLESRRHLTDGWVMWRWMPKHHLFNHFEGQVAVSGSPAECWCYMDESAIGEAVKVAESCHASTLHKLVF